MKTISWNTGERKSDVDMDMGIWRESGGARERLPREKACETLCGTRLFQNPTEKVNDRIIEQI